MASPVSSALPANSIPTYPAPGTVTPPSPYTPATNPLGSLPENPQSVSDLFTLIGQGINYGAQATAASDLATGDLGEAATYGSAEDIAAANARLATISGQVEQEQEQVQLGQTIGAQKAAVAGGGFAESGSALDLLRSSTQQGLLQQQITGTQAALQSGGYAEQAQAYAGEASAATAAGNSQSALAAGYTQLSSATKTFAGETAAAMGMKIDPTTNTPALGPPTTASTPGVKIIGPNFA
jgi:hypothetical protein